MLPFSCTLRLGLPSSLEPSSYQELFQDISASLEKQGAEITANDTTGVQFRIPMSLPFLFSNRKATIALLNNISSGSVKIVGSSLVAKLSFVRMLVEYSAAAVVGVLGLATYLGPTIPLEGKLFLSAVAIMAFFFFQLISVLSFRASLQLSIAAANTRTR